MKSFYMLEQKIRSITDCEYKYFFSKANVIGVGSGVKVKNGFWTGQKCITVFVTKKFPMGKIAYYDLVPNMYKGIPTDVRESNIPKIASLTSKVRPVIGGYCIGVNGLLFGSIGCLVGDNFNDYILTCNHVVAGNSGHWMNREVLQPSVEFGGVSGEDEVGRVNNYIYVDPQRDNNYMDAALVKTDRLKACVDIALIGTLAGSNTAKVGQQVQKVGAVSELTRGQVISINTTMQIQFMQQNVTFKDQIVTSGMGEAGDSGSVLVNKNKQVLGLFMASSNSNSIFNNIARVLGYFNVIILRH